MYINMNAVDLFRPPVSPKSEGNLLDVSPQNYDEDSREGKYDEDEPLSQPLTDSKYRRLSFQQVYIQYYILAGLDFDNVDEDDDGTFQVII